MRSWLLGEDVPKGKKNKKKETGFELSDFFILIAFLLLAWLILKSLHLVDPPEDFSTYILEAILGAILAAQFAESWEFRKRTMAQGERIARIEGILERQLQKP